MRWRMVSFLFLVSVGCQDKEESESTSTEDSGAPDSDADTDTDTDTELYGPPNQWYHADVSDVPAEGNCGYSQGSQACNFTLTDQNGDQVELYQFSGKVVVLDLFAEW